jgi:transcriptional regulator with XRE-family HTH domain
MNSEKLLILRRRLRLTQGELGQRIGVSRNMIHRYENGHVTPHKKTLIRLAKALNTTTEELEKDI